jgi:hypothetical protein
VGVNKKAKKMIAIAVILTEDRIWGNRLVGWVMEVHQFACGNSGNEFYWIHASLTACYLRFLA